MHVNCPHCHNAVNLVLDRPIESLTCPSCGSNFNLTNAGTVTYLQGAPKQIGRFELIESLGSGHFGDVWLAKDPQLDRFVALKLPRKEELEQSDVELFLREARAAAQLKHPNIVSVYDVGMDGDRIYIVSELVRGPNLADWLLANHLLPQQAAELCATLAEAVHYAHENGVIHRDLKPSNVLLDEARAAHVTDFGLAKRDGGEITVTVDGKIMGTPAYMSPEQARGDGHNADRRSDVYSLGVMLYEFLTGARPFSGKSKMMLIYQVLTDDPRPPRKIKKTIPRDLETICLKAMEKEPVRRYPTAADLAADLRRFLAGKPIVARPVSRLEKTWRLARRNRLVAALSLVTSLAVVVALATALVPHPDGILRRTVQIKADRPNANIAFVPLNPKSGEPQPDTAVAGTMSGQEPVKLDLPPGDYLVVAYAGDADKTQDFHEVYRHVPDLEERRDKKGYRHQRRTTDASGVVVLGDVQIFSTSEVIANMAFIPQAADFKMGTEKLSDAPPQQCRVPAFYLDTAEVTVGDAKSMENWFLPEQLSSAPPADSFPLTNVRHEYAVAFAERVGKRLMDEAEYEVAATRAGSLDNPWGGNLSDIEEWNIGPVRHSPAFDVIQYDREVFGLYSNAVEWTSTWGVNYSKFANEPPPLAPHDLRIVRGGSIAAVTDGSFRDEATRKATNIRTIWDKGPRMREKVVAAVPYPGLGFRCARSQRPRLRASNFIFVIRK